LPDTLWRGCGPRFMALRDLAPSRRPGTATPVAVGLSAVTRSWPGAWNHPLGGTSGWSGSSDANRAASCAFGIAGRLDGISGGPHSAVRPLLRGGPTCGGQSPTLGGSRFCGRVTSVPPVVSNGGELPIRRAWYGAYYGRRVRARPFRPLQGQVGLPSHRDRAGGAKVRRPDLPRWNAPEAPASGP